VPFHSLIIETFEIRQQPDRCAPFGFDRFMTLFVVHDSVNHAFTFPAEAGAYFSDPGEMEG